MDNYAKAKTELAEIDRQIAALQQRKVVLRQFIDLGASLYGDGSYAHATPPVSTSVGIAMERSQALPLGSRDGTAKSRILEASEKHIRENGPTLTRDLLAALEAVGIEVGGSDKVNALSVLLSKSGRFQASRIFGWSLPADAKKEATPQSAPTPAGSDVVQDDAL